MKLDKIDAENTADISASVQVICEGKGDAAFVRTLLDAYGLVGFQVRFPTDKTVGKYGKDAFGDYLFYLTVSTGFARIAHIIVMRDCDEDCNGSFEEVCKQIERTGKYSIPAKPKIRVDGPPSVTVLMIPDVDEGNLETLLLCGLKDGLDYADCFKEFFKCCDVDKRKVGLASKMQLATIVAIANTKNPTCSLASIWGSDYKACNPIDINHDAFKWVVEFFKGYAG